MPCRWIWRARDVEVFRELVHAWATICNRSDPPEAVGCVQNLRVTIRNDSVQPDFVKIRGLKLQHFVYTLFVNLVRRGTNFFGSVIRATKTRVDELFAVLIQEIERIEVRARGNFDQFCKAISDLCSGQGAKEGEIEKGVHRCMVSTEAVLVIAIVDSNLNRHRCVYQTNDGGRDSDEIGVPAVSGTSEPAGDPPNISPSLT